MKVHALLASAVLLASPAVFAQNDLCQTNLQEIDDNMATNTATLGEPAKSKVEEYVKQARHFDAELMVGASIPAAIYLCLTDNTVVHVQPGQWYDVSRSSGPFELAVAAVSPYCTAFNVQTMQTQLFVQTGNGQATGSALLVDR